MPPRLRSHPTAAVHISVAPRPTRANLACSRARCEGRANVVVVPSNALDVAGHPAPPWSRRRQWRGRGGGSAGRRRWLAVTAGAGAKRLVAVRAAPAGWRQRRRQQIRPFRSCRDAHAQPAWRQRSDIARHSLWAWIGSARRALRRRGCPDRRSVRRRWVPRGNVSGVRRADRRRRG